MKDRANREQKRAKVRIVERCLPESEETRNENSCVLYTMAPGHAEPSADFHRIHTPQHYIYVATDPLLSIPFFRGDGVWLVGFSLISVTSAIHCRLQQELARSIGMRCAARIIPSQSLRRELDRGEGTCTKARI